MNTTIRYRAWQFWQSLKGSPDPKQWEKIQGILDPSELELFKALPIPDQNHSLRVLSTLQTEMETDPDLLKAALMHDIGKTLYPLRRWERVFAVLLSKLFPGLADKWGGKDPRGMYKSLVVVQQHPGWGAQLAAKAGSSQRVVWLIRHHEQDDLTGLLDRGGVELLEKLQTADNIN